MAWRYLFSRKSHSAVSIIAVVSMCGVAIATMAIVCVLSVFNGFHDIIRARDTRITPDIRITSAEGALIANADSLVEIVRKVPGVAAATPVVEDNGVAIRDIRETPVNILGIDPEAYRHITALDSVLLPGSVYNLSYAATDMPEPEQTLSASEAASIEGVAEQEFDEAALLADIPADPGTEEESIQQAVPHAILSIGTAVNLGIAAAPEAAMAMMPAQEEGIVLFEPRRTATLNVNNPAAALMADSLAVSGIFQSDQSEFDNQTVIIDLQLARRLLEYDTQAGSIYVAAMPGTPLSTLMADLQARLGDKYTLADRARQQTLSYRMVSIEKWITFLLLSFILLIASFNIISTLSMLIVEKKQNISTLSKLGASRSFIGTLFFWESIFVCGLGIIAGMAIGIGLCELQQHFGLIKMAGDASTLIVSNYPVKIVSADMLLILLPGIAVALLTGFISSKFARRLV